MQELVRPPTTAVLAVVQQASATVRRWKSNEELVDS